MKSLLVNATRRKAQSADSTVGGAFSMVKLILISLLFRVDDNMKYSLLMLVVFFFFFLDQNILDNLFGMV